MSANVDQNMNRLSCCTRRQALCRGAGALLAGGLTNFSRIFNSGLLLAEEPTPETTALSTAIDELALQFMKQHSIPGLSLAMSKSGQMILCQSWGMADKETSTPVTPLHRFRIASISKPITSVTIFKLIESGQLKLTDCPLDDPRLLGRFLVDLSVSSERLEQLRRITIQHLLEHTSGGWSNEPSDPMSERAAIPLNHEELIRRALELHPLQHPPGEVYAYSNFGYSLLGRVIEQVTGQPYEQATTELTLKPAGVSLKLAGNYLADRLPDEVVYYGNKLENPYNRATQVRRRDAHGGWLATPTELVKWLWHYDLFPSHPDLLRKDLLQQMWEPSAVNANYAKGWCVNSRGNCWHTGGLHGTAGILVRTHDEYIWAVLMNSRHYHPDFYRDLDAVPWNIRKLLATA